MDQSESDAVDYLDGKLLIAMPGMGDQRFERSVVFVCAHSAEGAMGLIVNKPMEDLKSKDLLEQLNIQLGENSKAIDVHFGGPVEHGRGFVLHSPDYSLQENTMDICGDYAMTATVDILKDLAAGNGPRHSLLALGYAGWGPGQLESEIQSNGWLICDSVFDLVFSPSDTDKWDAALNSMGVDPRLLSAEGGQA